MEFLNKNVGWRTILLVQFQPQYVAIILLGVFFTSYIVITDLALAYSQGPDNYHPGQYEFLMAFDFIYSVDVITMTCYKLSNWDEAKQIFSTRHAFFIFTEFITCIPSCLIYKAVNQKYDYFYYAIRCRYCVRIIRIGLYFLRIKKHVGNPPFISTAKEFITVMALYMIHINLIIFIYTVKEGFTARSFMMTLYYTVSKATGKGVPIQEDTLHQASTILLFFTFISYMMYIYYVGSFITAIMQTMREQFMFVNSLERIMNTVRRWKFHSIQMYNTILEFYLETWDKRGSLSREESYTFIVPEVMSREIKLDICWDAFKHSHIFRTMEVHYLRYLSTLVTVTFLTPGELIYKKGKFKSRMVYIITGVIQLLSEEDGETPILSLSGGTCLGETSLFLDQPSSCTVVCKRYSEVCILEKKDFFKSYDVYPDEFKFMQKSIFKRYDEARHFVRINKYQIKNSMGDAKSQVLTMKWLKKTLQNLTQEGATTKSHIATVNLDDRLYESSFQKIIFCARYLDLMVISEEYELSTDTILLKHTCPIIFQPNSIIINCWKKIIAILALFTMGTYAFYVCLAREKVNLYTLYIYFLTIVWMLDVYIQSSTAVVTKEKIIAEISKILIRRLSTPAFFIDIAASVPLELVCYIMVGDLSVFMFHIIKVNRLLKCYRIFDLFDISSTQTAGRIIIIKYFKLIACFFLILTNLAGVFFYSMCMPNVCSSRFQEFLYRRMINIRQGARVMIMCYYLSLQFIGGLILGDFPVTPDQFFIAAQAVYFYSDMYFLADVAAAETLRNKNKLKYHEFVSNVNIVMRQWDFNRDFRKRVIKYCVLQWEYDQATYLLYQEKLFANVPFDLFKIGQHISFARSVSHIPIFQELPDEVVAMICVHMERAIIPPGEVITYSGEVCKEMYVIEAGFCEMIAQSRTTAKVLGPGDSFSVIETCLNVSTVNTVITLTDCKILSLTYENYLRTMRYYPHVLTEINTILHTSIDWVGFEQLLNKEFLDIESYTPDVKSFNHFGYQLDKDSKEYDEFHIPFNKVYFLKSFKFILLRTTITPHGEFIRYWEYFRGLFAGMTCLFSPITIISATNFTMGKFFLIFLDLTAWADIYVRHHIAYFNEIGVEVTHPLKTAQNYWKHGYMIDVLGVFPFDLLIPVLMGLDPSARLIVYLRLPRLLQGMRVYNMFNFYIYTTGHKPWIIMKYFLMVIYFQNICSFFIINTKCEFDRYDLEADDMYADGVYCYRYSWISPNESFQHPITPARVYAYGLYFIATITTFKGLEGFYVFRYSESMEIVLIIWMWLCLFPYFSGKLIASVMYRNVGLVVYQNAMNALVKFMKFRKIDPILKNEVIEHFEYIWHKKKGRNESEIFKVFNIALHEDALYHIYGKVMQESSIFRGASKSFFKSLLLNVKHEIVLKRGIISKVNDVHGIVYLLFKGQVEILGPDYNKLLTLPVGSVFGHLDSIKRGRQTLSFIAKGHVELLAIDSTYFHSILSKYRGIRTYFKSLTAMNVDYLINHNEIVIPEHIFNDPDYKANLEEEERKKRDRKDNTWKKRAKTFNPCFFCENMRCWRRCNACCYGCCDSCINCCSSCSACCSEYCKCFKWCSFFTKIHNRGTVMKIWEAIVLGVICFVGSIIEFFQKSSHDQSVTILAVLYTCDILFVLKIFLQFHTAYDDERGLSVTDRKLIAQRYFKKILGFRVDLLSSIPFEVICLLFRGQTSITVFTYCRLFRLLRVILVIDFFHSVNQKLNINVMVMRLLYLMVWVILILQFLVFFLFFAARFDPTMEQYSAHLNRNFRYMTYLRQIKVIMHMFSGSQIDAYKPNACLLIIMTVFMMVFTRFIIAIFIAETCATLETVLHNKTSYETKIECLKNCMTRETVSPPLFQRVWLYVKLLWIHHKGEQFPSLLSEAPIYLREGVLNSMFGFHIRSHPILQKCHTDLIRQMAACMTTRIFFSGDFLVFVGDIDGCMYFIHEGEVCALSEDSLNSETIEKTYTAGQMFGLEQGLYKRCGHEYTYRANSYCVVILLQRNHWIHLLDYFPASKYLIFDKDFEKNLTKKHDLTTPKNVPKPTLPKTTKRTIKRHRHKKLNLNQIDLLV